MFQIQLKLKVRTALERSHRLPDRGGTSSAAGNSVHSVKVEFRRKETAPTDCLTGKASSEEDSGEE